MRTEPLRLSQTVYGGRDVFLVTSNMKHLPVSAFKGTPVRPARPNIVLKELLAANSEMAIVLAHMLARFKAPPVTKEDLLDILDAANRSGFATALGKARGSTPRPDAGAALLRPTGK